MLCKKCGAESPEESTFCVMCGERIDGKKVCTLCKTPINEGDVFCTVCGTRVDGKKVCVCGKEQDAQTRFCPQCGIAQTAKQLAPAKRQKCSTKCNGEAVSLRSKIFAYVATSLSLLSLLVFFIAIFTPMFKTTTNLNAQIEQLSIFSNKFYDYFYKLFSDFSDMEATIFAFVILGISTVIVVTNIGISTTMLVTGLVVGIKSLVKGQSAKLSKFVVCALASNIVMAVWFNATSFFISSLGSGASAALSQSLGAGSIIAYVFAAIALITCAVFAIIEQPKEFIKPKRLAGFVLVTASVLFTIALMGVVGGKAITASDRYIDYYYEYSLKVGFGIIFASLIANSAYDNNIAGSLDDYILSVFSSLIFIAIIVLCAMLLFRLIIKFSQGGANYGGIFELILSSVLFVLAAGYMVLNIMLANTFTLFDELLGITAPAKVGASAIAAPIIAFFILGICIAAKIIAPKRQPSPVSPNLIQPYEAF